jgi:hypothetical protein
VKKLKSVNTSSAIAATAIASVIALEKGTHTPSRCCGARDGGRTRHVDVYYRKTVLKGQFWILHFLMRIWKKSSKRDTRSPTPTGTLRLQRRQHQPLRHRDPSSAAMDITARLKTCPAFCEAGFSSLSVQPKNTPISLSRPKGSLKHLAVAPRNAPSHEPESAVALVPQSKDLRRSQRR